MAIGDYMGEYRTGPSWLYEITWGSTVRDHHGYRRLHGGVPYGTIMAIGDYMGEYRTGPSWL